MIFRSGTLFVLFTLLLGASHSFASIPTLYVNTCGLKIRNAPKLNAKTVGFLRHADTIQPVAPNIQGNVVVWAKIGEQAYISAKYLRPIPSDSNAWNQVQGRLKTRCTPKELRVKIQEQGYYIVSSTALKIRSGPSMDYAVVGYTSFGDKHKGFGIENEIWVKIGTNRYVSKKHLIYQATKDISNVAKKPIAKTPSTKPPEIQKPIHLKNKPSSTVANEDSIVSKLTRTFIILILASVTLAIALVLFLFEFIKIHRRIGSGIKWCLFFPFFLFRRKRKVTPSTAKKSRVMKKAS